MSIDSNSRPILISTVQYQHLLENGSMTMLDVIDKAHQLDVDGLELRRDRWPAWETELPAARARLDEQGLLRTFATFSTLFNDAEEDEAWLQRDIQIALDLAASQLRIFQGKAPAADSGPVWDAARRTVERAASQNLVIALENAGGPPGQSLSEVKRVLDLIPGLSTNVDIGNFAKSGQDVLEAIQVLDSRISSTHLKDVTGGTGWLDASLQATFGPIFDGFAVLPQRIIHCFEFSGDENPDACITSSLAYLRVRDGI